LNKNSTTFFEHSICAWYQTHQRNLPWRHSPNPYHIWLSEIILQQTKVAQGLPYYYKFLEAFPTVKDLALAPIDTVLRQWQGLGYYSRARNLHLTAQKVHFELGGVFPDTYKALLKLKGIGTYTAAAIASFAYNEAVPVVDGNVFRVLARVYGLDADIASTQGKRLFEQLSKTAATNITAQYNQAIMEFGALCCTPQKPQCGTCCLQKICLAFATNKQNVLPVKTRKLKVKSRFFYYFLIENKNKIWLELRGKGDIWQGLYQPFLLQYSETQDMDSLLGIFKQNLALTDLRIEHISPSIKHKLTHQELHIQFIHIKTTNEPIAKEPAHWYSFAQTQDLPKPIPIAKYLEATYLFSGT
jgi:A/G-specific adenine glycosylase